MNGTWFGWHACKVNVCGAGRYKYLEDHIFRNISIIYGIFVNIYIIYCIFMHISIISPYCHKYITGASTALRPLEKLRHQHGCHINSSMFAELTNRRAIR